MSHHPLTISMDVRGVHLARRVREHLDRGLGRLDTWTRSFSHRSCRVAIHRHQHDDAITSQLVLELPGKVIVAEGHAERCLNAVDRCLRKAARQLRDFKMRHRNPRAPQRLPEAVDLPTEGVEEEKHRGVMSRERREFEDRMGSHREHVRRFLVQEAAKLTERIPELVLPTEDLVEETLMEALDGFSHRPWSLEISPWLDHLALDVLDRHLHERLTPTVSLEEEAEVPGAPNAADHFGGLDRLRFAGEREDEVATESHAFELLAPGADDPVAAAEEADLERSVEELLSRSSPEEARAFRLHFLEGFDLQETARILGRPEESVRLDLKRTEIFVRHRLGETASAL